MASFSDIINKKKKEWDCPDLMDRSHQSLGAKIPFSSPLLNYCCYGGIPRNKVIEFFGEPGGGKSTTAVDICKNAYKLFQSEFEAEVAELRAKVASGQKQYAGQLDDLIDRGPKKILYIDLENSFDDAWCKVIGLDSNKIEIMTPPDMPAEEILQTLQDLIETGELGLAVLDSIPSLVPKAELEKKYGEKTVAALAGLLNVFYRKLVPLLTRYGCTFIGINQVRENMDNPYNVQTPGGKAPKFYASLRILFQLGYPVDFAGNELKMSAENPAGYIVNAKIMKQKSAPNNRKLGTYYLMVDSGIREDFDFAKLAINKYGAIRKSGGWFTVCDPYTGEVLEDATGKPLKINGLIKVYDFLKANTEYYEKLKKFILDDINGVVPEENEIVEESLESEDSEEISEDAIEASPDAAALIGVTTAGISDESDSEESAPVTFMPTAE